MKPSNATSWEHDFMHNHTKKIVSEHSTELFRNRGYAALIKLNTQPIK